MSRLHSFRKQPLARSSLLLPASCALAAGALAFSATLATARCNSGDTGTLVTSTSCQATTADAANATAIGEGANASGINSTALGQSPLARGTNSTAIGGAAGPASAVIPAGATNIGANSGRQGGGHYSTAIGAGSDQLNGPHALGSHSIAIGAGDATRNGARAAEDLSISIGSGSNASAKNATALGRGARALKRQSVAIGSRSVADVANTVSVGRKGEERRIMHVDEAIKPTDAVNLKQVKALIAAALAAAGQ